MNNLKCNIHTAYKKSVTEIISYLNNENLTIHAQIQKIVTEITNNVIIILIMQMEKQIIEISKNSKTVTEKMF